MIQRQIDVLGNVTLYGYDAAGRLVKVVQRASQPQYDNSATGDLGLNSYVASPLADQDIITTTAYDPVGNMIRTTDPAGHVSLTGYDVLNRPVKTIRSASQPNYDIAADPTLSRYVPSGLPDQDIIDHTERDSLGRVTRSQDTLGNWTLFGYDSLDRQIKVIRNASSPDYNSAADPSLSRYVPVSDPDLDIVTATAYDRLGRVMYTTDALGHATWSVYDGLGRVVKTIANATGTATDGTPNDPRSPGYAPSSDPDKDVITQTVYDTNGYILYTQDALGHRTWFAYDSRGRQIKTIVNAVGIAADGGVNDPRSDSYLASPDPDKDIIATTSYDPQGRVLYTQDALGRRTWAAYDSAGRQIKTIVNAVGTATDGGISDPRSDSYLASPDPDKDIITTTSYDPQGRAIWTQDSVGRRTWFAYDSAGRQVKTIANAVGTVADGSFEDPRSDRYIVSPDVDKDLLSLTAYDSAGRTIYTQDAITRRTWFAYDNAGRQINTVVNALGAATDGSGKDPRAVNYSVSTDSDKDLLSTTFYDSAGRVIYTQDPVGRRTWFAYDRLGRQIKTIANAVGTATDGSISDPRSPAYVLSGNADQDVVTQTLYNKAGQVVATIDALGNTTHYSYDGLGRRMQTIANFLTGTFNASRPDQDLTSTTVYNKAGQVVTTIDPRGTQTAFAYDGAGRRLTTTQAAGTPQAVTTYTCYDKAGQVLRTIQNWTVSPSQPSLDARDARGNWLFTPWYHGRRNDQNLITTYTLDLQGRQVAVSDPLGNTTHTTYTKDGQVESMTDPLGVVTQYRYDLARRRTTVVTSYQSSSFTDPFSWTWDGSQWLDGNQVPISFGSAHDQNIIVQTTYDRAGHMTALRDPRGNQTTYTYDALDRRTSLADPLAHLWNTQYINSNNLLQTTLVDPNGAATQQTADGLGRLKAIQYLGESPKQTPDIAFTYDRAGSRTRMTETSDSGPVRTTAYAYDAAHRLRQVDFDTDGDGTPEQTVSYAYDAGGLRTRMTLPGGLSLDYAYDARGQLSRLTDWTNPPTTYAYDNVGRLVTTARANGLVSRYAYDPAGRISNILHNANGQLLSQFTYSVDARGNRVQAYELVPHVTTSTTLDYDDLSVQYNVGTWTAAAPLMTSTDVSAALHIPFTGDQATLTMGIGPDHSIYDVYVDGDLWRTIDGYALSAGTQTYTVTLSGYGSHSLDIRNRPERNLQSSGYTLRFQSLLLVGKTYDWQTFKYSYDALSRLVGADVYAGTNTGVAPAQHFGYSYDLAGNRTQKVDPNGTVNYAYDAANRLRYDDTYTYVYDNNGNLTTRKQGMSVIDSYGWDRANRLVSFNDGTAYQYAYDGEGRRVQQTVSGTVTQYLLDVAQGLWKVVAATTGANTTHYVHDQQRLLSQQNPDSSQHWPVQDGLDNVRSTVDNSLTPQESKFYWPYGEAQWTSGDNTNPQTVFGFTGEPTDVNKLVQLRARYLNPGLGVFASLDPLELANRYAYVKGNPTNLADHSGTCPENPWWNDIPGQRCVWLANELHQKYGWSLSEMMSKDVTELEITYLAGNANSTFNESSWSQTVREHPAESLAIGFGAAVLIPIVAAGGAAVALPVMLGAAIGFDTGDLVGFTYGEAMYAIAASGQCGYDRQQLVLNMGESAFVSKARSQAALYGTLYGSVTGTGPFGQMVAGGAGIVQGAQGLYSAGQDIKDAGLNNCNAVDALLSTAGMLAGASGIKQGYYTLKAQQIVWNPNPGQVAHIFRNAAGHVNPSTAAEQQFYIARWRLIAADPSNFRADAVQARLFPPAAQANGMTAYTKIFWPEGQYWVFVRSNTINDAGVNPPGGYR